MNPTYEQLIEQNRNLAEQINLLLEKYNALKINHEESHLLLESLKMENAHLQKLITQESI